MFVIPHPRFGINGLADGTEHTERRHVVFRGKFIAKAYERANGRGRGVEGIHFELLDNFPEASGVGISRHAFEHERGAAVAERSVNNVAVAGHPTNVSGAEINVVLVDIKNVFVREGAPEQISSSAVDDALRFAGGTASVEDEEIIFGLHLFCRAFGGGFRHQFVIPHIASSHDVARLVVAFHDDDLLNARRVRERGVGELLERERFSRAERDVRGDEQFTFGIVDAACERIRTEPTEHNRVNRTDARAREHGDGGFGNHRHVNRDAVAFDDAERFEDVGELADILVKLGVGDVLHIFLGFALPDDGGLVANGLEMAVEAVDGDIQFAVLEPRMFDDTLVGVPLKLAGVRRFLEPIECGGLFHPEFFRVVDRARIHRVVLRGIDQGVLDDFRRRREGAASLLQGFGRNGVAHFGLGEISCRISENKKPLSIARQRLD